MNWLTKKENVVKAKIDKPKPTTPAPDGQKWAWSAEDKDWILVTASKRTFINGSWVAEAKNQDVYGKVHHIKGGKVFVDWGKIPASLEAYNPEQLISIRNRSYIPKKTEAIQIEDSFSNYMKKRKSVRKILSIFLEKTSFKGSNTISQKHVSGQEKPLVFEINSSIRKKGTKIIGKILDVRKDNSLEVEWKEGNSSIVWKQEIEPA